MHAQQRQRLGLTIIAMALTTVITTTIVMSLKTSTVIALITQDGRALGAGGSCVGRSEATRAPHSIWPGPGHVTEQTPVDRPLEPSWCGPIT
ncbi:MAG TPA: hypothetical protein VHN11_07900 [Xanthobacteraceae bacterium]|nr:hypothetical protein [Xanthobacteraceae bacterium]